MSVPGVDGRPAEAAAFGAVGEAPANGPTMAKWAALVMAGTPPPLPIAEGCVSTEGEPIGRLLGGSGE